jgi:methionyl aminopeptidase
MSILLKSVEEFEILKVGGERHARILRELRDMVAPGMSTFELEQYAQKRIKEYGDAASFHHYKPEGAKRPYPAALCVSINEEIVHGIPNEDPKILKDGDIVSIDLGLTHEGLITDAALTVAVGNVTVIEKELIRATREALDAGIMQAKGGNTIGDIGFAIESVAKKYGFALAEGLSGHGVGYDVHEDPYVPNSGKQGKGEKLVPGMVIAIEPMLVLGKGDIVLAKDGYTFKTKDGKKSTHFEHTVGITEGDPIVFTRL